MCVLYPIKDEVVPVQTEGKGGLDDRRVLQLSENAGTQEDRRTFQVERSTWGLLPVNLDGEENVG